MVIILITINLQIAKRNHCKVENSLPCKKAKKAAKECRWLSKDPELNCRNWKLYLRSHTHTHAETERERERYI